MRLRAVRSGPADQGWADALAMFSLVAPLFLVVLDVLEVALPYRPWPDSRFVFLDGAFGSHPAIGGLSLVGQRGLDVAAGGQVIIAVLVLLGLRRLALAAMAAAAVYWFTASYWIPEPLQLFSTGFYLLEAAALIGSPGPRHGRHLVNWGHGWSCSWSRSRFRSPYAGAPGRAISPGRSARLRGHGHRGAVPAFPHRGST
jgi:hypothetical protein